MPNRELNNLKGTKIAAAFLVMAIATFLIQMIRLLGVYNIAEFAYIGVMLAGWTLMFVGLKEAERMLPELKKAYLATLPALAMTAIEAVLAAKNISDGVGDQSFITIGVMFMVFASLLLLLYCYSELLDVSARLSGSGERHKKIFKRNAIIIILMMYLVPVSGLFPRIVEIIVTTIAALTMLVVQLEMIRAIRAGFNPKAESDS